MHNVQDVAAALLIGSCLGFTLYFLGLVAQSCAMLRTGRYSEVTLPAGPLVTAVLCLVLSVFVRGL